MLWPGFLLAFLQMFIPQGLAGVRNPIFIPGV
jgi:hypothetical protein